MWEEGEGVPRGREREVQREKEGDALTERCAASGEGGPVVLEMWFAMA